MDGRKTLSTQAIKRNKSHIYSDASKWDLPLQDLTTLTTTTTTTTTPTVMMIILIVIIITIIMIIYTLRK